MIEINNYKILTTSEDIRYMINHNSGIEELINPDDPDTGKYDLYSIIKSHPVVFDIVNLKILGFNEILNIYLKGEDKEFIKTYSEVLFKNRKFNTNRNNLIINLIVEKYNNIEDITPNFIFNLFENDLLYPLEEVLLNNLLNILLKILSFFDKTYKNSKSKKEKNYLLLQFKFALLIDYNKKIESKYQDEIFDTLNYIQNILKAEIDSINLNYKIGFDSDAFLFDRFWSNIRCLPLVNKKLTSILNGLFGYSIINDTSYALPKNMLVATLYFDHLKVFESFYIPNINKYYILNNYNFKITAPYSGSKKNYYKTIKSMYFYLIDHYNKIYNYIKWYDLIKSNILNGQSYRLITPKVIWINYKEDKKNSYGDLKYIYKSKLFHIRVYLTGPIFDLQKNKLLNLFKELSKKGLFKFQSIRFKKGGNFKNQINLDISKKLKEEKVMPKNNYFKSLEILKVEEI